MDILGKAAVEKHGSLAELLWNRLRQSEKGEMRKVVVTESVIVFKLICDEIAGFWLPKDIIGKILKFVLELIGEPSHQKTFNLLES